MMSYPKTPSKGGTARTPYKTPRRHNIRSGPREAVQVFGRLRPLRDNDDGPCVRVVGKTDMVLTPPESSLHYQSGRRAPIQHTFHEAFGPSSTQKEVFDSLGLPLVTDLLNSKNGLLFAYGITGSGKTHTMTGEPHDPGILPRCLDVVFNSIQHLQAKKHTFMSNGKNNFEIYTEAQAERERKRQLPPRQLRRRQDEASVADTVRVPESLVVDGIDPDCAYGVVVSFVEIFNEYVFDLLEDVKPDKKDIRDKGPQSKKMREDTARHQMYISDVTEVPVSSTEEAYEQLVKGQKKRRVAQTQLNDESSRSHSIFNIRLIRAPLDEAGKTVLLNPDYLVVSQLSLVDLAGSERAMRTQNMGERLREAGNINQSLMVLRTCLEYLRDNQHKTPDQQKIVPYRDSKVTQLFKNFFEGDGKVRMMICCSSATLDFDEMLHVMKFAEVTQAVTVARSQAIKFDIPGLAPGRRQINQMVEAMTDGEAAEDQQLPFTLEVVPAPDTPHTSFSPFASRYEKQTLEFESGRHFLQRGMDAFKAGLFQAISSMSGNEALAVANEELQLMNKRLASDVQEREERLQILQQIIQSNSVARGDHMECVDDQIREDREREQRHAAASPAGQVQSPMSPDTHYDKENNGYNQAPIRARKRRSNENWLEHKPEGTLEIDTVLQPKVKKSKVVTIPKKSDLAKKQFDRYMLHHQEEDSIGEMKEQLFKGAMMKTRSGGMSVQFTDVETLQQRRPELLQRSNPSPNKATDVDCADNRVDIQTRCATAFEGHPGMTQPSAAHRVASGR